METIEVMDVTTIEPHLKHPNIFRKIDLLANGDSFIIMHDSDPELLYFQLLAERGAIIDWDYLQKGLDIWKIKITRRGKKTDDERIGEIVTKDIRKAKVFRKYGIDFCRDGKKSLKEVCEKKNLDHKRFLTELREAEHGHYEIPGNPDEWELDFLANYIVNIHHTYVKNKIPTLLAWSQKVANAERRPEAIAIAQLFSAVAAELTEHMLKEENVLFPFIVKMAEAAREQKPFSAAHFGPLKNSMHMLEKEHASVSELYMEIEKQSNHFMPPLHACNTFRALYSTLKEFEGDLFLHTHLENNILFPKAAKLEQALA